MATFTRFEEIDGWKKARELVGEVNRISAAGAFARDFGLRDQIRRASVSVMANIAEGFGRGGNREFVAFLSMARGSCAEVKSHAYVALDAGYLSATEFDRLQHLAGEAEALISGLMKYLAASDARGRKFCKPNREP
jgi:four helix bundle protein